MSALKLDKKQAGGEQISYKVEKPDGTPMMLVTEQADSDEPTVKATYIPEVVGMHSLRVYSSVKEILESPLPFKVKPAPVQPLGKPISLNFDLAGTSEKDLKCHFVHKETNSQYKAKIAKIARDKYNMSFSPKEPGLYALYVNDRGIKKGPIIIRYGQLASPSNVKRAGDSPTFSIYDVMKAEKKDPPVFLVGSNICFKVNKQQAGSEEISYNVEKPDGTFVPLVTELNDSDKTTVKATYTPDVIGMHSLKMYSSGKEISTSPVLFMVEPDLVDTSEKLASPSDFKPTSFSPNFCECDVLKMEKKNPPTFVVGSNVCFEVNKRQVGGEKVSYKVEKPDGTPMMLPIEQADSDHPTVKATYIPEVIGMHSVRVYSSNNEIPESPLPFEVKPARNQLYGKSISLNLDLVGTSEEELTCRFIEKDSKLQYKGKISKIGKDKYNFSFFPKDVGLYSLYIKDRGIKRGPIIIRYGQPASPSNLEPIVDSPTFSVCDVMKVEKKDPPVFLVGSNICFEVNKQQAGSDEISYNVEKPDGTFVPLVTELNDSDKTTVKATYTPDVIGMHSLKVYSSGKEIPTSPLPFKVEPAPSSTYSENQFPSTWTWLAPVRRI